MRHAHHVSSNPRPPPPRRRKFQQPKQLVQNGMHFTQRHCIDLFHPFPEGCSGTPFLLSARNAGFPFQDVDVVATLKGIYYTLLEDGTLPDTRSIMSSSTASQPAVASAFAKYVTAIRALEDTAEVDADAEADHEG